MPSEGSATAAATFGDARMEIEEAQRGAPSGTGTPRGGAVRRERVAWASALVALGIIAAAAGRWGSGRSSEPAEMRVDINTPANRGPDVVCDLTRWTQRRLQCRGRGRTAVVAAIAGRRIRSSVDRDRRRRITLLVAGRPIDRVLRGQQTETDGSRRRPAPDPLERAYTGRRNLEPGWLDPLCSSRQRRRVSHLGDRNRAK